MTGKTVLCTLLFLICLIVVYPGIRFSIGAENSVAATALPATEAIIQTEDLPDYRTYYDGIKKENNASESVKIDLTAFSSDSGADIEIIHNFMGNTGSAIKWINETGNVVWSFDVPVTGLYNLNLKYYSLDGHENPIDLGFKIDGKYLFSEMQDSFFPRLWENAEKLRVDGAGNEFAPEQIEKKVWITESMKDPNGLFSGPFIFGLNAGRHTLTIIAKGEPFVLSEIEFSPNRELKSYDEISSEYNSLNYMKYSGDEITIQGEDATIKTTRAIIPKADNSSPSVFPSDPFRFKINYIGSYNWQKPNERVSWSINIPKSGLYKIGIKYRQYYLRNIDSYRKLMIDGKSLFSEAETLEFPYGANWSFKSLSNDSGDFLFYFEKGTHELSMEVTLGPIADFSREIQKVIYDLGTIYRSIVMITGELPDPSRDYDLFNQIPDLEARLTENMNILNSLTDQIQQISGSGKSSDAVVLSRLADVISRMIEFRFRAQEYKNDFYNAYGSASAWMFEMRNMPLDIDKIVIAAPDKPFTNTTSTLWEEISFSIKRFISSFISDYSNISKSSNGKSISVWINWGRDQAQVLSTLTNELFVSKKDIPVNIKLVNSSLIQAILSGNGPDCTLMISRTQPVNLAMRGALYDLKAFSDFEQTISSFMPNAINPYLLGGGCYGLPDTQQYFMMFYRSDILKELGIEPPKTWPDFFDAAAIIQRNNLQVGIPYTQITDIYQTDAGIGSLNMFPTLMLQFGVPMYNEKHTATNLTTPQGIAAFTFWTDIYTQYKFPISYDFYSRFRTGELVIAIASYTEYSRLVVAAPEINGRWDIAPIPGFAGPDGTVNNVEAGSGTASVILNISKNKDLAWEYLKWWTSAETQYRYATEIESILGIAARHSTSNVEAFSKLSWKKADIVKLISQWEKVEELPEVPGGYFVPRTIDQAFWNVVYNYQNPRDTLMTWSIAVDNEISRKRSEYNLE